MPGFEEDVRAGIFTRQMHYIHNTEFMSNKTIGRGLPADFNAKIGASMGMELLQGLTDDSGGSFSIETKDGTPIKVIFEYNPITAGNVSFS